AGVALLGWIGRANQDQGGSSPPPGQVDYGPLPLTHPALVASEGGTTLCCVDCHRPGADHPQPRCSDWPPAAWLVMSRALSCKTVARRPRSPFPINTVCTTGFFDRSRPNFPYNWAFWKDPCRWISDDKSEVVSTASRESGGEF
ncbi:MAG: hypothetical protein ABGX22_00025, partial [Pirellulaceae bacterium]